MKVCLDVSAAIQQSAGISRYEKELLAHLLIYNTQLPPVEKIDYRLFYNLKNTKLERDPREKLPLSSSSLPCSSLNYNNKVWRMLLLAAHYKLSLKQTRNFEKFIFEPPANQNSPLKLFHAMDYIAPPLRFSGSVVTVYDLSFLNYPRFHTPFNRNYLKIMTRISVKKAQRVIAISKNTRQDLINWLGPEVAPKIEVIYLAAGQKFFEKPLVDQTLNTLKSYNLNSRPFFVCVGTLEPRKNQHFLVKAYADFIKTQLTNLTENLPLPALVLVGKAGWGDEYKKIQEIAKTSGLILREINHNNVTGLQDKAEYPNQGEVLIIQGLKDSELLALYQRALASCYVSINEGFGLPPLEAMAAGTPVILADNSSLTELAGPDREAALLVETGNINQLTRGLLEVTKNQNLREKLSAKGRERGAQFSWLTTAETTVRLYREAAAVFAAGKS